MTQILFLFLFLFSAPVSATGPSCLELIERISGRIRAGTHTADDITTLPALLDRVSAELDRARGIEQTLRKEQLGHERLRAQHAKLEAAALDSGLDVAGVGSELAMNLHVEKLWNTSQNVKNAPQRPSDQQRKLGAVPVGIIHLDIDGLKAANDVLGGGHQAGDAVIKGVLDGLAKTLREADGVKIFRPTGDEIVIIVKNGWHIEKIADRISKILLGIRIEKDGSIPSLSEMAQELRENQGLRDEKLRGMTAKDQEALLARWAKNNPSVTGSYGRLDPRVHYKKLDDYHAALWAPDKAVASRKAIPGGRGRIHHIPEFLPARLYELPKAEKPADGLHLVQRNYGYVPHGDFIDSMSTVIKSVQAKILQARSGKKNITSRQVQEWLDEIAAVRAEVEQRRRAAETLPPHERRELNDHGRKTPDSLAEFRQNNSEVDNAAGNTPSADHSAKKWFHVATMQDNVPKEHGRHLAYYRVVAEAAERMAKKFDRSEVQGKGPTVKVDGENYPITFLQAERKSGQDYVVAIHPSFFHSIPGRRKAFQLMADALNRKDATPEQMTDTFATAMFLLYHNLPYLKGTPSIVESFMDASLRAAHERKLPSSKESEPFWDIMAWDPTNGPYTGQALLRNYAPE